MENYLKFTNYKISALTTKTTRAHAGLAQNASWLLVVKEIQTDFTNFAGEKNKI